LKGDAVIVFPFLAACLIVPGWASVPRAGCSALGCATGGYEAASGGPSVLAILTVVAVFGLLSRIFEPAAVPANGAPIEGTDSSALRKLQARRRAGRSAQRTSAERTMAADPATPCVVGFGALMGALFHRAALDDNESENAAVWADTDPCGSRTTTVA
jgi:hypothetical protein